MGLTALLFATACATAPARPPVQVGDGTAPRVDPVVEEEVAVEEEVVEEEVVEDALTKDGLTPPHMAEREIKRAAVLLPFSHPNANVRAEAEAMLAAIELALFEFGDENTVIIPKDTAGKTSVAKARMKDAITEGADLVLGPLFGANVQAVRDSARKEGIPVVAFSNDRAAAGGGAYLASIAPEEEVRRVMQYVSNLGVRSFAFLGPDNDYGRRVESAMRSQVARQGGAMISSAFYNPSSTAPVDEALQISNALQSEIERAPGKVAVMIPERGVKLLSVAPLLPYNGVDLRQVKVLGTGLWNDSSVWREPSLYEGYFASANPSDLASFKQSYQRIYGRAPSDLAVVGYDAAAMAMRLASEDKISRRGITNRDGFLGSNGLFRFRSDGTSERGLSILQIKPNQGAVLVEPGPREFGDGRS